MTVNGRLEFCRSVFWNEDHGTVVPLDILLGIESSNHSLGVREICCRESLNNAFGQNNHVHKLFEELQARKIHFESIKDKIDLNTTACRLIANGRRFSSKNRDQPIKMCTPCIPSRKAGQIQIRSPLPVRFSAPVSRKSTCDYSRFPHYHPIWNVRCQVEGLGIVGFLSKVQSKSQFFTRDLLSPNGLYHAVKRKDCCWICCLVKNTRQCISKILASF